MPTYRVDLAYDGTHFHGYAKNRNVRTVQGEVETALATVFGHPVDSVCAGRTDAGVHARQQVVSFSSDISMDTDRIHRSLTAMLGPEIVALDAMVVPDDFSARFSATMRAYRYRVLTGPKPDPLRRFTTWHQPFDLDVDAMNRSAGHLTGAHDFASFCRQAPKRTSVRTVLSASWVRVEDVCELRISARAPFEASLNASAPAADTATPVAPKPTANAAAAATASIRASSEAVTTTPPMPARTPVPPTSAISAALICMSYPCSISISLLKRASSPASEPSKTREPT